MKLKTLMQGLKVEIKGPKEVCINDLSSDSRKTKPSDLFIAKKGMGFDGADFIPQAIDNGASAVLTSLYNPFIKTTQIIHPSPASIEALLASRLYQAPSKELFVFGVTGTNGKTTSTYLVKHLLDSLGMACGLSSTIETVLQTRRSFSVLTTHDAIFNQKTLREMVDDGCKAASLEVSSHGLDQGRVDQIAFDVVLFTNLTPDHLDYHKSMDAYALAKKKLFTHLDQSPKKKKMAIANADDPYCDLMLSNGESLSLTFAIEREADLRAEDIELSAEKTTFTALYQGKRCRFSTFLIGRFNVYNLLGAIAVGLHLGCSLDKLREIFASFSGTPGRLERVLHSGSKHVFVDYAHTADALRSVLVALKGVSTGRVITVFGAGGGRDPGRRQGLAQAAEALSDRCIITSDNPRHEDPEEICRQILNAIKSPASACIEVDRKRAIERAIQEANPGDVVLIAGKGHETVQIFAHQTIPFDDREVARMYLEES